MSKLHLKLFPASKPTNITDADALRPDGLQLQARKQFMRLKQRLFGRAEKLGDIDDASHDRCRPSGILLIALSQK